MAKLSAYQEELAIDLEPRRTENFLAYQVILFLDLVVTLQRHPVILLI